MAIIGDGFMTYGAAVNRPSRLGADADARRRRS
jgi:hypothetical protein